MEELQRLRPKVRLEITNPDSEMRSVFGPGIARLCKGVRERGSLNASAKGMGMAYSKAWRVIKDTETSLGIRLLDRDGARGSTLTEAGDALLDAYLALDESVQQAAIDEYNRLVG